MDIVGITRRLRRDLAGLRFSPPVAYVYSPLDYARLSYARYLRWFGRGRREAVMVGMNPGPWGMAQTGVPFGEVSVVRDWLGIRAPVGRPSVEHPQRPVLGFACHRSEISGARLWGWARDLFCTPERFFARFFVTNYCPLCFFDANGRNLTPDKLPRNQRDSLYAVCDHALKRMIRCYEPRVLVAVGRFAEARIREVVDDADATICRIPHPSPANPAANRGWASQATVILRKHGLLPG